MGEQRNAAQVLKSIETLLQQQNSKLDAIIRRLQNKTNDGGRNGDSE